MKVIRFLILGFLFIYGFYFSQNIDSLELVYQQYYETKLITVSNKGQYFILNHSNNYGKDVDVLFDVKYRKETILEKHDQYRFLGNDILLMRNRDYSRYLNLKTHKYLDISGNYAITIANNVSRVILYDNMSKEIILTSLEGNVLWKEHNISSFQLDEKLNNLIYVDNQYLGVMDIANRKSTISKLDDAITWTYKYGKNIYAANIESNKMVLYTLDLLSHQLTKQIIMSLEGFEFSTKLISNFEIREDEHFILPMYLKSKLRNKEDSELKITYSNKNGRDNYLNHHLGIYNIKNKKWEYQPNDRQHLPVYKFLNENGDFIVYDQSNDMVEEQQNVVLDLNLILDYGKETYLLPHKRIDEGNYLWDRNTEQFVYFIQKKWISYNLRTGEIIDLVPKNSTGWENPRNNGLVDAPAVNPIKIKNRSAFMLSNQFDYFILDLKTYQLFRITNGEKDFIKYELNLSKEDFPKSAWNVNYAQIDLEKEITLKKLNQVTFDSGFATYSYKNNKIYHYHQKHYREIFRYENGFFLTSHFALEPFALTKVENGKYNIVYESLKTEQTDFKGSKFQIYQYKTSYGTANAALLYPIGYDAKKKYPMIVNIYQQQTRDLLYFLPPYLKTTFGFNYMHYLMNGYIVLLPDLQYDIGNIKNSVISSLEKSIDTAKPLASIDDKNIGIIGLSYGGYETGLALTNSKYFKTGVAGVMISDLVFHAFSKSEFMSMPNYMRTENQQMRMGRNVFESWNNYLENSPIFHLPNLDVPVLIWSGLKDKNVNPAQSKMFFLGIKRLQKKAVLLEYVNETHNVLLPSNQLDLNVRIWQWFDYYLKNKPAVEWIYPITK